MMHVKVNGKGQYIDSVADLQPSWDEVRGRRFSEVWLEADGEGPSLSLLVNGDRAWLMYLPSDGSAGFSSRNPGYDGPREAMLPFEIENGQGDEFPLAWTLPLHETIAACEYFVTSGGERSPALGWHDDELHDEEW